MSFFSEEVLNHLKKEAEASSLVLFVGNGTSRILGCPSWYAFACAVLEKLFKMEKINFDAYEYLKNKSAKEILSYCQIIIEEEREKQEIKGKINDFSYAEFLEADPMKESEYASIYENLYGLGLPIITTNYDKYLIDACKNYFKQKKLIAGDVDDKSMTFDYKKYLFNEPDNLENINVGKLIDNRNIIFLHGNIENESKMVLSVFDYAKTYSETNHINQFLLDLFSEKWTVLFIGLDLSEMEIIANVLPKADKKARGSRHFLLYPIQDSKKILLEYERKYYQKMGIKVIDYSITSKGYDILFDVVKELYGNLNQIFLNKPDTKTPFIQTKNAMYEENELRNDLTQHDQGILEIINSDKYQFDHFFNNEKNIKWFSSLKKKEYFKYIHNPEPIESQTEPGYFFIPQWVVLSYLEKISDQINKGELPHKDRLYFSIELILTIKDVTNGTDVDNWRTWWFFVKILNNLPSELIESEISDGDFLNFIKNKWLKSKFDNSSVAIDMAKLLLPKFIKAGLNKKAWIIFSVLTEIHPAKGLISNSQRALIDGFFIKLESYWLGELLLKSKIAIELGKVIAEAEINALIENFNLMLTYKKHEMYRDLDSIRIHLRIEDSDLSRKKLGVKIGEVSESQKTTFIESLSRDDHFEMSKQPWIEIMINDWQNKNTYLKEIDQAVKNCSNILDAQSVLEMVNELHDQMFDTYSYIWCESIHKIPFDNHTSLSALMAYLLRDLMVGFLENKDSEFKRTWLVKLLNGQYQYRYDFYKRLGYFLLDQYFDQDIFMEAISNNSAGALFEDDSIKNEITYLLKNHVVSFSEKIKQVLKTKIDKLPIHPYFQNKSDVIKAYRRQIVYANMKEDSYFKRLYEKEKEISKTNEEEINAKNNEANLEIDNSPKSSTDLLNMSVSDLASYLQNFKSDLAWNEPAAGGLAIAFQQAVANQPNQFVENIMEFINCYYLYTHHLIEGFVNAPQQEKVVAWNKIWIFFKALTSIENSVFWNNANIAKNVSGAHYVDNTWIISDIANLIYSSRATSVSFTDDLKPVAVGVLKNIAVQYKPAQQSEIIGDYLTYSINSPHGKIIQAMINFAYSEKELKFKYWESDLRGTYGIFLKKSSVEAFTFLGESFLKFWFMDREWLFQQLGDSEEKVKLEVFPDKNWKPFMKTYLFAVPLYNDVWTRMKFHYARALKHQFDDDEKSLMQHIALANVRIKITGEDKEFAKDLYNKIIDRWDLDQIESLIRYYYSQEAFLFTPKPEGDGDIQQQAELRKVIMDLWEKAIAKLNLKSPKDQTIKSFYSNCIKLLVGFEDITDKVKFDLFKLIPYVPYAYNSPVLIEILWKFRAKGYARKYIPDIYLEMLKHFMPDFDKEKIKETISDLYIDADQLGTKNTLHQICNQFAERGDSFLEELYEKYK